MTHPVDEQDAQKPTPWLVRPGGPSDRAPRDSWVWFSSPESFASGQRSVLAVLEIPLAMGLFWWLASHTPWPLMTLIGLLAAPLLLLRSPESIAWGVEWLRLYWAIGEGPVANVSLDRVPGQVSDQRRERGLRKRRLSVAIATAIAVAVAVAVAVAYEVAISVAIAIAIAVAVVLAIVISDASAGAGAGASAGAGTLVLMGALALALGFAYVYAYAYAYAFVVAYAVAVAAMVAIVILIVVVLMSFVVSFRRMPIGADGNPFLVLCYVLGVSIRSLVLRIVATLRELPAGLRQYPVNCRESMLVMDFFHIPELMPQARTVSSELDLASYWRSAGLAAKAKPWRARWTGWMLKIFFSLLIYLPTSLYRLNLKANAWLWGLIAWVFSPARWPNEERQRESTQVWTTNLLQGLLGGALLVAMPWLVWPWASAYVPADALKDYRPWFVLWPAPVGSLRYGVLCILCVGLIGLLVAAYVVRSAHGKALESANDFKNYPLDAKERVFILANQVRRWRMACTAVSVLTAWVFLLWAAVHYFPDTYGTAVWAWLRSWL